MAKLTETWVVRGVAACLVLMVGCTNDDEGSGDSTSDAVVVAVSENTDGSQTDSVVDADAVVDAVSETLDCAMSPAEVSARVEGVPAPRRSLECESPDAIILVHRYDSAQALQDMIDATGYCHPHITVGSVLVEAVDPVTREHLRRSNGASYLPEVPSVHDALEPFGATSGRC